ncbi:MAG: hypothetical protein Kow0047_00110 [Anaerolineae bacterium]
MDSSLPDDIEARLEALRQRLLHSWRWYHLRRTAIEGRREARADLRRLETLWARARDRFLADLEAINRELASRPDAGHIPPLDPERELRALLSQGASRDERAPTPHEPERSRPAQEPSAETQNDVVHQIIVLREKIPHTPRWEQARKRALWRYIRRWQDSQRRSE